jgi:proline dehydrogenase
MVNQMRTFFLFLSRQKQLRKWMETSRWARRLSARFVAGDNLPDALATCRRINAEGIAVTLDHLGENVTSLAEAAASRDAYLQALTEIDNLKIEGNVSLKLTQFGMDLSLAECTANVEALVRQAAALGNFVRVDMESSEYTGRTLDLVTSLHARYRTTGTVIQAYLYRSRKDVEMLCARGIRVRLCKGAYLEPPSVAFKSKADVDRNFVELMNLLLETGVYPAIATHDEKIVEQTKSFVESRKISRDSFVFQML